VTIERAQSTEIEALALARRSGWPEDMRVLLDRYPREQWDAHANLGEMARFWLSRHAMFRELSGTIEQVTAQFRAGNLPPMEFARQFAPRLQFILDQLNVHNQIEDFHYFPIFRAADTRLAIGFDVLEGDHHHIHGDMARTAETANALLQRMPTRPNRIVPMHAYRIGEWYPQRDAGGKIGDTKTLGAVGALIASMSGRPGSFAISFSSFCAQSYNSTLSGDCMEN